MQYLRTFKKATLCWKLVRIYWKFAQMSKVSLQGISLSNFVCVDSGSISSTVSNYRDWTAICLVNCEENSIYFHNWHLHHLSVKLRTNCNFFSLFGKGGKVEAWTNTQAKIQAKLSYPARPVSQSLGSVSQAAVQQCSSAAYPSGYITY